MILTSSLIMLKVSFNEICKQNITFEEDGTFYSFFFDDNSFEKGELHWTTSYQYGTLNILYFVRKENFFYLFTSTPEHAKIFKKVLLNLNPEWEVEVLKVPRNSKIPEFKDSRVENLIYDKNFGFSMKITFDAKWKSTVKFYSNGIITYKMNNDLKYILGICDICESLVDSME